MNADSLRSPLVSALLDPGSTPALAAGEWNVLLLVAQENGLLARLEAELATRGLLDSIPAKARAHLYTARINAQSTQIAVRFEINRALRALAKLDPPLILLKGAAYVMADLPPARGRFVGDLDVMVPRETIDEVERSLVARGWVAAEMDEYDQRHYRERTHEIPPLQHPERETPLDIHHTIAPLTSRVHPDAGALLAASVPLPDPRLRVLAPADMVLHSSVHLFNDEVGKPLRDLFDLHDLLCHFGKDEAFWNELAVRARLHGLGRPLYYLLRYTKCFLRTPIPAAAEEAAAVWAPMPILRTVMDWLFDRLFLPAPVGMRRRGSELAQGLLYLRAHWLRMPPLMLARHLAVKTLKRIRSRFEPKPEDEKVF